MVAGCGAFLDPVPHIGQTYHERQGVGEVVKIDLTRPRPRTSKWFTRQETSGMGRPRLEVVLWDDILGPPCPLLCGKWARADKTGMYAWNPVQEVTVEGW